MAQSALTYAIWSYTNDGFRENQQLVSTYSQCLYTRPAVWCSTTFDCTHGPKIIKYATLLFLSFRYTPKRPSPFFIYTPEKNPLSTIMYELSTSCQQTGKILALPRTPPHALLMQYNLFMGVNKMCVKNFTVTVSVRVSITVRVSLVWLVSITVSVRVSVKIRVSLLWFVSSNSLVALRGRSH